MSGATAQKRKPRALQTSIGVEGGDAFTEVPYVLRKRKSDKQS